MADEPIALDAVTVRARNRIERLQDVPISESVITGKDLDKELAYDIGDIARRAGNLQRVVGNSRTYSLALRGIGKVGQTEAQDPSVGVTVDGVPYAFNPLASFDFFDIDAVEVARGPQGTLVGKNTTMGNVSLTTRRPSFTPDASYSFALGANYSVRSQVSAGGPVVDDVLAWRGALSVDKGEGDIGNRYNPDQTYFNRDRVAGRVQFLLTPSPDFNARAGIEIQPKGAEFYNSGVTYRQPPTTYADGTAVPTASYAQNRLSRRWFVNGLPNYSYANFLNSHSPNVDNQQPLYTSTNGAFAELNWNLPSGHTVTSVTGYRDYHFWARNDEGTPFDISKNGGGKDDKYFQYSEEVRLASPTGGPVDYQTGAMFFFNGVDFGRQAYNAGWGSDAGAWFATNAQYATLDNPNAAAQLAGATRGSGDLLLRDSLNGLLKSQNQIIRNRSFALFGQANWHLDEKTTLTTGLRFTNEIRKNSSGSTIADNGAGGALNPANVNGVNLGGFNSDATTGALTGVNTAAQLALANQVAQTYFQAANYGALSPQQLAQVAAAKAIRATQLGTVWNQTTAAPFKKMQPAWVISPSYKFNDDLTTYFSYSYGEKAGISQINPGTGTSYLAKPEQVSSLELGLKSALLDKKLILNANLFQASIKNYQQTVQVLDITGKFVSATGNAPLVQTRGLEFDGVYAGITHTTLRFSGAYTEAIYKKFQNSAQPAENNDLVATQPFRDVSGKTVAGAPRLTYNLGADYRIPVFGNKEFHSSINAAYSSEYNSDIALSKYGLIHPNYVFDGSIGIGRVDKTFDFNFVVKNIFNDKTPQSQAWTANGQSPVYSYVPAYPRFFALVFSGKL